MNYDNNHFIDAGQGISGILYPPFKRAYNSQYDGKGTKQPSTYSEEVYGYGWSSANQHPSTQRSNGFVEGSIQLVASGILYGGLDWVYNPINGSYKAKDGAYCVFLFQSKDYWTVQLLKGSSAADPIKEPTLAKALKLGLWILTGKSRPEPLV